MTVSSGFIIEVLVDGTPTVVPVTEEGNDLEVLVGTIYSETGITESSVIEVFTLTETDNKIEAYPFAYTGQLQVTAGNSQLPIEGGTFSIVSFAARIKTAPTGSDVVLDIKKNGITIFAVPADRPTVLDGANVATVGSWGNVTLTDGDYLSIDITQVGSTFAGADLTAALRLRKVG